LRLTAIILLLSFIGNIKPSFATESARGFFPARGTIFFRNGLLITTFYFTENSYKFDGAYEHEVIFYNENKNYFLPHRWFSTFECEYLDTTLGDKFSNITIGTYCAKKDIEKSREHRIIVILPDNDKCSPIRIQGQRSFLASYYLPPPLEVFFSNKTLFGLLITACFFGTQYCIFCEPSDLYRCLTGEGPCSLTQLDDCDPESRIGLFDTWSPTIGTETWVQPYCTSEGRCEDENRVCVTDEGVCRERCFADAECQIGYHCDNALGYCKKECGPQSTFLDLGSPLSCGTGLSCYGDPGDCNIIDYFCDVTRGRCLPKTEIEATYSVNAEDIWRPCITACGDIAAQVCWNGEWGVCLERNPLPEQCNDRIDNDCDGLTDCDDNDCAANSACIEDHLFPLPEPPFFREIPSDVTYLRQWTYQEVENGEDPCVEKVLWDESNSADGSINVLDALPCTYLGNGLMQYTVPDGLNGAIYFPERPKLDIGTPTWTCALVYIPPNSTATIRAGRDCSRVQNALAPPEELDVLSLFHERPITTKGEWIEVCLGPDSEVASGEAASEWPGGIITPLVPSEHPFCTGWLQALNVGTSPEFGGGGLGTFIIGAFAVAGYLGPEQILKLEVVNCLNCLLSHNINSTWTWQQNIAPTWIELNGTAVWEFPEHVWIPLATTTHQFNVHGASINSPDGWLITSTASDWTIPGIYGEAYWKLYEGEIVLFRQAVDCSFVQQNPGPGFHGNMTITASGRVVGAGTWTGVCEE